MSRRFAYCAWLFAILATLAGCGSSSATTTVGPTPVRCQVQVSQATSAFSAGGGTGQLTVSAARECQWAAAAQTDWIALAQSSGQGDGAVQYTVRANPVPTPRRGSIVVEGQTVEVSQDAAPCTYDLDRRSDEHPSTGGTGTIGVRTHAMCGWTASSDVPWITISSGLEGAGPGSVRYTVTSNPGPARTGRLTVGGRVVEIIQHAAGAPGPTPDPGTPPPGSCQYDLSPRDASIGAAASDGRVHVTTSRADCTWTAASSAPWLTITAGASGSGNGDVSWAATANTGTERTGSLTIGGIGFTVRQGGSAPVEVTITGAVSDLGGSCPALTFVVSRTRVTTDRNTSFQRGNCRHVENGLSVQVTGVRQADDSVRATVVELRRQASGDDGDDD